MEPVKPTRIRVIETDRSWKVKEPRSHVANGMAYFSEEYFPKDGRWHFNGDFENPTFTPSLNVSWGGTPGCEIPLCRNHFIVTGGMISYCGDCTHEFAGRTLPLEYFNEVEVAFYAGR